VEPLFDVAEEASGACLGLHRTRTHTVHTPLTCVSLYNHSWFLAVTTKHRRHRNRKFERLLEPNPAPTITHFVSVYTLNMPPAETLVISMSGSSVSHPSTHPTATPVSIPLQTQLTQTTTTIPNDGERFFFEDIFHVVSFFMYAAGPGEKL